MYRLFPEREMDVSDATSLSSISQFSGVFREMKRMSFAALSSLYIPSRSITRPSFCRSESLHLFMYLSKNLETDSDLFFESTALEAYDPSGEHEAVTIMESSPNVLLLIRFARLPWMRLISSTLSSIPVSISQLPLLKSI